MRELDTNEFRNEVENGQGIIIVDFNAEWCGPCKMQAPILEELDGNESYKIYGLRPKSVIPAVFPYLPKGIVCRYCYDRKCRSVPIPYGHIAP